MKRYIALFVLLFAGALQAQFVQKDFSIRRGDSTALGYTPLQGSTVNGTFAIYSGNIATITITNGLITAVVEQ